MTRTINWHTKAIYLVIVLAFVMGLAILPAAPTAAQTPPTLVPNIDYDVKGSIHQVCINAGSYNLSGALIDWWLESGVQLTPTDITVISPSPDPGVKVKGNVGGDNVTCIQIRSMKRGDIHIFVTINATAGNWTLQAEKKWGELDHTELDVDAATIAVDNTHHEEFAAGETGTYNETLKDYVYATFLEVPGDVPVDGAIVHWWAVNDTTTNQDWVDALMNYIASNNGSLDDDHWAAHGKYKVTDTFLGGKEPWQYINDWATTGTRVLDPNLFYWCAVNVPGEINTAPNTNNRYAWAVTANGTATATLCVNVTALVECTTYNVMIVVLVSYPSGSTPQDDPFNGENIICVEKGKKSFHKGRTPGVTEVKTPQLRWAGEKIVLEKDWSDLISAGNFSDYMAEYNLESESVGTLHPAGPLDFGFSEGKVFAYLDQYGVSRCILESEQSGEADVDAALYSIRGILPIIGGEAGNFGDIEPVIEGEIGFLVYFLEFEDVTLATDITPWASLSDLTPDVDDAEVAVRVRGFFDYKHSHLMPTMRPEQYIDLNDDGNADKILPAGRYVLPDDWWLIAETEDIDLRPNFDLMDEANHDTIVSPLDLNGDHVEELGPYDTEVRTTDPPGEADDPCIGPFSTLQPWSTEDMWIADNTVPSSKLPGLVRNTVVPDGTIDEWDAPMPQALVIFKIVDSTELTGLYGLDKGNLAGYGVVGSVYQSPFYAVEIPASPFIPPAGYNWDSWGSNDPYDYWEDLGLKSIISSNPESPVDTQDVEVFCDNHGIAGVAIDDLDTTGKVTITATAEFPYTPKRGKYGPRVSDEIDVFWGIEVEHLNPDFEADPRSGAAPLLVQFENLTVGGTHPYTKAQWDFNGDGIVDITLTGTDAQVMAGVNWTFPFQGIYTIALTMTDSTPAPAGPLVHTETKIGYVTVTGSHPYDTNHNGKIDPPEALKAVMDYFDSLITKPQVIDVLILYFG